MVKLIWGGNVDRLVLVQRAASSVTGEHRELHAWGITVGRLFIGAMFWRKVEAEGDGKHCHETCEFKLGERDCKTCDELLGGEMSKWTSPGCPQCGKPLTEIRYPSGCMLNRDQWESEIAGNWSCESCPDNGRGKDKKCYFWDHELGTSKADPQWTSTPPTEPGYYRYKYGDRDKNVWTVTHLRMDRVWNIFGSRAQCKVQDLARMGQWWPVPIPEPESEEEQ